MNPQTLATLIDNVAEVGSSLVKDYAVRRQERQAMQEEMQYRKEIARIKNGGNTTDEQVAEAAADASGALGDPLQQAEDLADQYATLLEEARATEDCGMCEMLIQAISERPIDVQRRAIPELRVLKQKADSGASTEELKEYIRETEVLKQVMKEKTQERARERESGGDDYRPAGSSTGQRTLADA